jgi:N-acyl-D-amino-acid deacylase
MKLDLGIINGILVDGSGNKRLKKDVGVENGRIHSIGHIKPDEVQNLIDAEGFVVSPGFFDMHSHSDAPLLVNPLAESKVRQGVTTEVTGNCGSSIAPLTDLARDEAQERLRPYGLDASWSSFGEYLDILDKGVALNVVAFVGHGAVRQCAMDLEERAPTTGELEEMKTHVRQAMQEGAFGMTSGLVYPPGRYADSLELIELCKVVAEFNGVYASHIRGERETMIQAVKEAIYIGKESGVSLHISHHPAKIGAWETSSETLSLMEETSAQGIDVMCDLHPYIAGATGLTAILPPWAQAGGSKKILERMRNQKIRARMKKDMIEDKVPGPGHSGLVKRGMWDKIVIPMYPEDWPIGRTIAEIAKEKDQDPFDAYFDLVEGSGGQGGIIGFYYNERDIRNVLLSPRSVIGSDGSALAPYGVLGRGKNHPRSYGTFPMIFRKYVRGESRPDLAYDEGKRILSLEEAVRKMTSAPAEKLGINDRGLIRENYWADLVIFNLEEITDTATYLEPYQYPKGIEHLFVNGKQVINAGEHTKALPGKVLRHKK